MSDTSFLPATGRSSTSRSIEDFPQVSGLLVKSLTDQIEEEERLIEGLVRAADAMDSEGALQVALKIRDLRAAGGIASSAEPHFFAP